MKKTDFSFILKSNIDLIENDERALMFIDNPQVKSIKKEPPNKNIVVSPSNKINNTPRNMLGTEQIKKVTIERMVDLGVYHKSFDDLIHIYSNMIYEYEQCREMFVLSGYVYETETAAGGSKKSGFVSAMEVLRKDIGTYSDRLQLNPKARGLNADSVDSSSPLEMFFKNFDSGGTS